MIYAVIAVCVLLLCLLLPTVAAALRNGSYVWLPAYLARAARTRSPRRRAPRRRASKPGDDGPVHLMFLAVDHYEPKFGGADSEAHPFFA